jgi:hypothetical protein
VDALRKGARYNKTALVKAVECLPKQLDQSFQETLERVLSQTDEDASLAKQVLAWIHYSPFILPVRVLQQAIAKQAGQDPQSDDNLIDAEVLVSVCAGLVVLDEDSQVIRLVHYSVDEYFSRCFDVFYPRSRQLVNRTCLLQALDSGSFARLNESAYMIGANQFYYDELKEYREEVERELESHYAQVPFSLHSLLQMNRFARRSPDSNGARGFRLNTVGAGADAERPGLPSGAGIGIYSDLQAAWLILLNRLGKYSGVDKIAYTEEEFDLVTAALFQDEAGVRAALANCGTTGDDALSRCLAWAAQRSNTSLVRLLLAAGAKPGTQKYCQELPSCPASIEERHGSTCMEIATESTRELILNRWPEIKGEET